MVTGAHADSGTAEDFGYVVWVHSIHAERHQRSARLSIEWAVHLDPIELGHRSECLLDEGMLMSSHSLKPKAIEPIKGNAKR
jgi:hypothetical protein